MVVQMLANHLKNHQKEGSNEISSRLIRIPPPRYDHCFCRHAVPNLNVHLKIKFIEIHQKEGSNEISSRLIRIPPPRYNIALSS